jgi:hypothetical protein
MDAPGGAGAPPLTEAIEKGYNQASMNSIELQKLELRLKLRLKKHLSIHNLRGNIPRCPSSLGFIFWP